MGKWSEARRNYALDSDCYLNFVVQSGQFKEVVLLADCCRVRKINARGVCPTFANIAPAAGAGKVRTFVAHATEVFDPAFEAASGPPANQGEVRGHFSRALMAGLWGAAARPEGGVRAMALRDFLYAEVPRLAKADGHNQNPQVLPDFPPEEEPVFGTAPRVPPKPNLRITFTDVNEGPIRLEGPQINVFQQGDAATKVWELSVEAGEYILEAQKTGRQTRLSVRTTIEVLDVQF